MAEVSRSHYFLVAKRLAEGKVVPFLGAGVNLCDRPNSTPWELGKYLPNGWELTEYLATEFGYPDGEDRELKRVSEYVAVATGPGTLYEELRELFDADYPTTTVHRFLAGLPAVLRQHGLKPNYQLILTTNYDDVLERALTEAGEKFDTVVYMAEGDNQGKLVHIPAEGVARVIESPNTYGDLPFEPADPARPATSLTLERTLIFKLHGEINRINADQDSYVITEDHYIDYLARTDISNLLPASLFAKLKYSHLLFLGYKITDWNLRVLLNRIWRARKLGYQAWAVQLKPSELDVRFWGAKDVEVFDLDLAAYVRTLSEQVEALPPGR